MNPAILIFAIATLLPVGLHLLWWRYDRRGVGPVEGLSLMSGVSFGLLLVVIGFVMIGPGGPNGYAAPMRAGAFAPFLLPLGYWLIAARKMPLAACVVILAVMAIVAAALWQPLFARGWMREVHGGAMAVWSVVWALAALPFVAVIVRGAERKAQ